MKKLNRNNSILNLAIAAFLFLGLGITTQAQYSAGLKCEIEYVDYNNNHLYLLYSMENTGTMDFEVSSYSLRSDINVAMLSNAVVHNQYVGGVHTVNIQSTVFSYGMIEINPIVDLDAAAGYIPLATIRFDMNPTAPGTGCTDMLWHGPIEFPPSTAQRYIDFFNQPDLDLNAFDMENQCICSPPAGYTTTAVTPSSASFTWQNPTAAVGSRVYYKENGTPGGVSTLNVSGNTATVTGLNAGTAYKSMVRTFCSDGQFSRRSNFVVFSTPSAKYVNDNMIHVSPNPTTEFISVLLADGDETLEIYDLTGRLYKQINTSGYTSEVIDVTDMSEGMYLLRATNIEGNDWTERFVIAR